MSVCLIRRSAMRSNEKIDRKCSGSGVRADGSFSARHVHVKECVDCHASAACAALTELLIYI